MRRRFHCRVVLRNEELNQTCVKRDILDGVARRNPRCAVVMTTELLGLKYYNYCHLYRHPHNHHLSYYQQQRQLRHQNDYHHQKRHPKRQQQQKQPYQLKREPQP